MRRVLSGLREQSRCGPDLAAQAFSYAKDVAMDVLRFRIASIMLVVAIAALDFGAIRAMIEFKSIKAELLVLGALPMTNVLAVGLLIGQRRPGTRPFLLGFVAFGAMTLALYIATASFFPHGAVMLSMRPLTIYLVKTIGLDRPFVFVSAQCSAGVVMLGLPQLSFAQIGGLLSRKFMMTIRSFGRPNRTPS